jgi:hypothetical protein
MMTLKVPSKSRCDWPSTTLCILFFVLTSKLWYFSIAFSLMLQFLTTNLSYLGNGSADIFGAIRFAAKLLFRPGVSKTFILLPCTNCDPANNTVSKNKSFL